MTGEKLHEILTKEAHVRKEQRIAQAKHMRSFQRTPSRGKQHKSDQEQIADYLRRNPTPKTY